MSASEIRVNGEAQPLGEAETVAALMERLGVGAEARGVAVAVDGEVVPRGRWQTHALQPGDRVEVLRAVQGG
jgi:sulfur carrier protein